MTTFKWNLWIGGNFPHITGSFETWEEAEAARIEQREGWIEPA